jgi:hypothetical protein
MVATFVAPQRAQIETSTDPGLGLEHATPARVASVAVGAGFARCRLVGIQC